LSKFFIKISNLSIIFAAAGFLISCGGGGGGGGGASITFLDSGTSLTYNSSTASTWQTRAEFDNINAHGTSTVTPYESLNVHKAYGYGLSGDGKIIAILDSHFDTSHIEFAKKTMDSYGTLSDAGSDSANNSTSYHGNFVAGIAAADYNNNSDPTGLTVVSYSNPDGEIDTMMGVAYDADLHFADYDQKGSNTYYADHWALATTDAKNSSAVVQNNSWGFTNTAYNSSTSYTSSSIGTLATSQGLTSNSTSIDNYVSALNSFQDTGVVVYALSNTSSLSDADVAAALPEIYTQLNEAWITVGNVEITGSSGSETYTRKSAKCGSTASYCLVADGWEVFSVANTIGANDYVQGVSDVDMSTKKSGTSFAAPQVSGLIALLSEAFPSQTPAQLTDRLLASADNSFFTTTSNSSFANGITHGYNVEYGHGVPDVYAALQPITSSRMQESILIGDNFQTATVNKISETILRTNSIFGDSIAKSFENKKGYFYDALYGAFEYDFSKHLQSKVDTNQSVLNTHFDEKNIQNIQNNNEDKNTKINFSFTTDTNNQLLLDQGINYSVSKEDKNLSASYNYPLDVTLGFTSLQDVKTINPNQHTLIPYIDSEGAHYSASSKIFDKGDTSLSLGYLQTDKSTLIEKNALALSFTNKELDTALLIGQSNEKNGFLNNSFEGALSVEENNPTNFIAFKKNKKIKSGELMFVSSIGTTDVKNNNNSLIRNIDDIYTSSFAVNYSKPNILLNNSKLSLSISQPQRVESGSMTYDIPGLNNEDGTLNYTTYTSDLDPSGRQLDISIRYSLSDKMGINYLVENKLINDHGHVSRGGLDYQLAASMIYKF